jgi:predicted Zn-dependent protease
MGVLFLKFGRDDELQADELGFRYMLTGGYDPREMVKVFQMLAAQSQLTGGGRLPEWQSTHPDPGNRIRITEERVAAVQEDLNNKRVGTDDFLTRLNGMVYGVNPRLGFFEGTLFRHPDLRFQLRFPTGWATQNQAAAVIGVSPAQDALAELQLAKGTAAQASQEFFAQQGMQASPARRTLNGLVAYWAEFSATTESGQLRGQGTFVEYDGKTYRILTYTPAEKYSSYASAFQQVHASFERLTDARALAVQPKKLRMERLSRSMTLSAFNQAFPSLIPIEELAVINGVALNATLQSGQLVKRVVQ